MGREAGNEQLAVERPTPLRVAANDGLGISARGNG